MFAESALVLNKNSAHLGQLIFERTLRISGGRGSILGTESGTLILGVLDVLNNGPFLLNVSPFWQQILKDFVILAAVAIDKMNQDRY